MIMFLDPGTVMSSLFSRMPDKIRSSTLSFGLLCCLMEGNAHETVTNLVNNILIVPLFHLVFDVLGSVSALGHMDIFLFTSVVMVRVFGGTPCPLFYDQGRVCWTVASQRADMV